ncbi:MAG: E3 binding domain-containing protein, partial [Gammaproteobacteria bacterium]|nr:E3 binding domain-containing protein [Gammaproteobacteria bacterium]
MSIEINVPTLPESVADATVATWHKKPGDTVKRGENLVDIETDKIVIEVPAPADGVMGDIAQAEGATVTANQLLGTMTSADGAAAPAAESAAAPAAATDTGKAEAIDMPALPESVADATIATWHKKVGDSVKRGENLVDVETDKVVLEVPATVDGVLASIDAAEGSTVTQDSVLGSITAGAAAAASTAAPAAAAASSASDDEAGQTSPSVRALLEQHGLDASAVKGSGKNGRILPEDVEAAAKAKASAPTAAAAPKEAATPAAGKRAEERVPMTRLRKTIANRLLDAKQNTAMLTTFNEVNMK